MSSPITSNTSTIGNKHELPAEELSFKKQKVYWEKEHLLPLEEVLRHFAFFQLNPKEFDQISDLGWEIITKSLNDKTGSLKSVTNVRYRAREILFPDLFNNTTPPSAPLSTTSTSSTEAKKITQRQAKITRKCFIRFHQGYEKGKQENIHSTQPPCFSNTFNSFFEQFFFYELNLADQSFYLGYINAIQRLREAFFSLQEQDSSQESLIERLNTLYPKENESLKTLDKNIYQKVQRDLKRESLLPSSRQAIRKLLKNGVFPFELYKTNEVSNCFRENINQQLYHLIKNHNISRIHKTIKKQQEKTLTTSWDSFYEAGNDGILPVPLNQFLLDNDEKKQENSFIPSELTPPLKEDFFDLIDLKSLEGENNNNEQLTINTNFPSTDTETSSESPLTNTSNTKNEVFFFSKIDSVLLEPETTTLKR